MTDTDTDGDRTEQVASNGDLEATYEETATERLLTVRSRSERATIAQNREGYAMLAVRDGPNGSEYERYYGFDMALDHVAEILGVAVHELPLPEAATDMGM